MHSSRKPQPSGSLTGQRLRSLAFALLAGREWSRHQLRERLTEAGGATDDVDSLLDELSEQAYQSDSRMADAVVRTQLRKGRGPLRIRQALDERHLQGVNTQQLLSETDFGRAARLTRCQKFGTEAPTDPKEKARQYRYLQYRGFDSDSIRQAFLPDCELD